MRDFDKKKRPRRRDSGRPRRRDSDRKFEPKTMHKVTCDKCGEECEVPFKPTPGKPVYCDECFKKDKSSRSGKSNFSEEFSQINKKLDKILEAVNS